MNIPLRPSAMLQIQIFLVCLAQAKQAKVINTEIPADEPSRLVCFDKTRFAPA